MSTEKQANLARERHSNSLQGMGAHALAVDEIQRKGQKTFAVIAFFEHKPEKIPQTLRVKTGKRTLEVPLVARVSERFKLE